MIELPFPTITGTVAYHGCLTHASVDIVTTGPIISTATADPPHNFVLSQLCIGTYTVTTDAASYLPNFTTIPIISGQTIPLMGTVHCGDDVNNYINGGLVINLGDTTLLTNNFGRDVPAVTPPIELIQVDINTNRVINKDLAVLAGNYERASCQDW